MLRLTRHPISHALRTRDVSFCCLSAVCCLMIAPGASAQTLADTPAGALAPAVAQDDVQALDANVVYGVRSRDEAGRDEVFQKDVSNVYVGKEEIERYRGTSAADLFKGLNGVYSNDARNGGALDPNIRGIQGEGRVPVTVDGTEQAMSVWLGPAGVANRNYLDPYMISSIMVEKGPSMTRGVQSGIGGAVQIRTLMPEDIIREDSDWGMELKAETANNSTSVDKSAFGIYGMDYRDIPGATVNPGYNHLGLPTLPGGRDSPRSGGKLPGFNLEDRAWRLALATRQEYFDFLAAYSYRSRGNYFSGKRGSSAYNTDHWRDGLTDAGNTDANLNLTPYLAQLYRPGDEVANSASENESLLLKGGVYLPDNQVLRFNYMDTDLSFGEAMQWVVQSAMQSADKRTDPFYIQMPHSSVTQKTYGLNYSWQPEQAEWINLELGVWRTSNHSERHQNGDWPWGVLGPDRGDGARYGDRAWDLYTDCHVRKDAQKIADGGCAGVSGTPPVREDGRFEVVPLSLIVSDHRRQGVNASNLFTLSPAVSLLVSGDFQKEELAQADAYDNESNDVNMGSRIMGPRSGRRSQHGLTMNLEWAATSWLSVSAGARYASYWSFDDGLDRYRTERSGLGGFGAQRNIVTHKRVPYLQLLDDADMQLLEDYNQRQQNYQQGVITYQQMADIATRFGERQQELKTVPNRGSTTEINGVKYWQANLHIPYLYEKHQGFIENDPFLNGSMSFDEMVENPQGQTGSYAKYRLPDPLQDNPGNVTQPVPQVDRWAPVEKHRGSGWAPMLGMTAYVTPDIRLYARYAEAIRFPSIYEDTQSSNAYGVTLEGTSSVRPERARNWEFGYVHDLAAYFPSFRHVDVRLNYFRNSIRHFIDRDDNFNIVQFDKKEFSGIEFLSRWDSGGWYANIGTTYRLDQKVCDADYAAANYDPYFGRAMESCVAAGFPQTNARISLQPKYSIDLSLGARFLDDRLHVGGRMIYHSEAKNKQEARWLEQGRISWSNTTTKPFYWNSIRTFDAFANYRLNDAVSLDASITNITNEYYLDPLARTTLPAPGRTIRFGLTLNL
ncbi:TonB-dependent receptor [Pseudomonas sp. S 311-6]|nr:TonB-dependent receptor [Pseudomonas sp. S 311-6]